MGPANSYRISRVPHYSGFYYASDLIRIRDFHSSTVVLSKTFFFSSSCNFVVLQPLCCLNSIGLGFSVFARHYLRNHFYFLLLWVLRCFSSPRSLTTFSSMTGLQPDRLPHSDILGSKGICASPKLFAAYHVLLRLREPRHPPSALNLLSFLTFYYVSFSTLDCPFGFSRVSFHTQSRLMYFKFCSFFRFLFFIAFPLCQRSSLLIRNSECGILNYSSTSCGEFKMIGCAYATPFLLFLTYSCGE